MNGFWRSTAAIALALVLAVGGMFLFASRASQRVRHLRETDEPIQGWMSIPFVAHTHHVPAAVLFHAIGVQPREPHDHRSVRRLARELNRTVPQVIAQLQSAIAAAAQPPGGAPR